MYYRYSNITGPNYKKYIHIQGGIHNINYILLNPN